MISSTTKSRLLTAMRILPATMLLAGALSFAPDAGATGCHVAPSSLSVNGGSSSNTTTVSPQANGGTATANAQGGDDNVAIGILGGAKAGNGGTANAQANGGTITLGDINSGNNTGNVIRTGPLSGNVTLHGGTSRK